MQFDFENMYCGAIRRGDIFLLEGEKKEERAVLVLQENVLNDGLPSIVCAPIEPYRQHQDVFANEVLLPDGETGLGRDGICMLHRIFTADRHLMVSKKGELKKERLQEVYRALDITLGRFRDRDGIIS